MCATGAHINLRVTTMKIFDFNFLRIIQKRRTLDMWLDEFRLILNNKQLKKHTIQNKESLIKYLSQQLGKMDIRKISTFDLAELVNHYVKRGTNSAAKSMHVLLKEIFREAYFNGWIKTDPTVPLRCPKAPVKRSRITFEEFSLILEYTKKHYPPAFYQAFILALITGQRRSDIVKMKRSDVKKGFLHIEQFKTGNMIALPLNLVCEKLNMNLDSVINKICSGKNYLIESANRPVTSANLTTIFATVRDIVFYDAGYWNGSPPSFHEIRSLSERLYRQQGIDTMILLGHKTQQMTDKYNDSRGKECRYLRI